MDLIDRLLYAHAHSQQRVGGSDIFKEAAAEIVRLQAAKRGALAIADERAKEAVGLRAENERLRAALATVMPIAECFKGRIDMEPKLQIGRDALRGHQQRMDTK